MPHLAENEDLKWNLNENKLRSSVHCYNGKDGKSLEENANKTNGFTKCIRFFQRDKVLGEKERMPSCQSYNHSFYGTIEEKSKRISSHTKNHHSISHSVDKFENHSYYKELEKGYINKETPGPAAYRNDKRSTLSNFRVSFNGSFTKQHRNLSKKDSEHSPGPADYNL